MCVCVYMYVCIKLHLCKEDLFTTLFAKHLRVICLEITHEAL